MGLIWIAVRWADGQPENDLSKASGPALVQIAVFLVFLASTLASMRRFLVRARSGLLTETLRDEVQLAHQAGISLADSVGEALGVERRRLARAEDWLHFGANLQFTLGLIGTAAGLVQALGSLGGAVASLGNRRDAPAALGENLGDTLGGLSLAFVTTLLGALLGGVILRLLAEIRHQAAEEILELARQHLLKGLGEKGQTV